MSSTKERIIEESLTLFSTYGYSGVTMEDIASKVGIKAPSIYKHFKGKEDIYTSILRQAEESFSSIVKIFEQEDKTRGIEDLELEVIGIRVFEYFYHDQFISKVRKMISLELYKNPEMTNFYIKKYIEDPLQDHFDIFKKFQCVDWVDYNTLAIIFYSPIYMLLKLCDANKEREKDAYNELRKTYSFLEKIMLEIEHK